MNNTILTILSLSASGSVLVLLLLALRPFMRNKATKTFQYYIWLLVLLRLALPLSYDGSIANQVLSQTAIAQGPAASTPGDLQGISPQEAAASQGTGQTGGQITPSETTLNGTGLPNPDTSSATGQARLSVWKFVAEHQTAMWLLGASVHFGWFIIIYLRFSRKIRKTCVPPHPWDMESFSKLCGDTNVKLACNPYIHTPMLIGFLSPRIIIPQLAFVTNGMEAELQHILQHELTHYRRRDLLYKWFAVFVSSLHWFNPLMILVRREIGRSCELACDEAVIRSLNANERQDYGETLLAIASNKRLPGGIVTTTMCEEKRELKERLENIMTFKGKNVFMAAVSIVLALSLAGCGVALGAANVTYSTPDNETSQSPLATDTPSAPISSSYADLEAEGENTQVQIVSNETVLEAYKAVLLNQAEFISADNEKSLYLNDFLTNHEIYMTDFEVTNFAVLDMDGDQVPEVILELSVGGEPQFFEVLHEMNGKVYGYLIVYRGLTELKADGTFLFSSGAADYGVGKLTFVSTAYATVKLGYSESSQGETEMTISYFINNETVTKEAFDSFVNEQVGKEDAVWYEFSQDTIEAQLS